MANFLGKFGKTKDRSRSLAAQGPSDIIPVPSSSKSDFEKTFKPFLVKKDAELAPLNWFIAKRKGESSPLGEKVEDAILVDDCDARIKYECDTIPDTHQMYNNVDEMSCKGSWILLLVCFYVELPYRAFTLHFVFSPTTGGPVTHF